MHPGETIMLILSKCLDRLREIPGVVVQAEGLEHDRAVDARVEFQGQGGAVALNLDLKVRMALKAAAILPNWHYKNVHQVYCTGYVNRNEAVKLKGKGVNFLDTAGNMFLSGPGIHFFVTGMPRTASTLPGESRIFKPAGLRILWALFQFPELINMPNRQIAEFAGVAYGGISDQIRALEEQRLIRREGRGFRLNVRGAFDRWVQGYAERLRPKLVIGRYRASGGLESLKERLHGLPLEMAPLIGGELGAAMAFPGLIQPGTAALYLSPNQEVHLQDMMHQLHLAPTRKESDVVLLRCLGGPPARGSGKKPPAFADAALLFAELATLETDRLEDLKEALFQDIVKRSDEWESQIGF